MYVNFGKKTKKGKKFHKNEKNTQNIWGLVTVFGKLMTENG